MIRYIRKGAIAAALATVGLNGSQALCAPVKSSPQTTAKKGDDKKEPQIILLKIEGKPDRKCTVLSTTRRPDGMLAHLVKAQDNGEEMTILEPAPAASRTASTPAKEVDAIPSAQNPPPRKPLVPPPAPRADTPKTVTANKPNLSLGLRDRLRSEPSTPETTPVPVASPSVMPTRPSILTPQESSRPGLFKRLWGRIRGESSSSREAPASVHPVPSAAPIQTAPPPLADPFGPELRPQSMRTIPEEAGVARIAQPHTLPATLPGHPATGDHLFALKEALQPSERQAAAEALVAEPNGKRQEVRTALLTSVQQDPAPAVRVSCLRCLAKQGVHDQVFQAALISAQRDFDPAVRQEARSLSK